MLPGSTLPLVIGLRPSCVSLPPFLYYFLPLFLFSSHFFTFRYFFCVRYLLVNFLFYFLFFTNSFSFLLLLLVFLFSFIFFFGSSFLFVFFFHLHFLILPPNLRCLSALFSSSFPLSLFFASSSLFATHPPFFLLPLYIIHPPLLSLSLMSMPNLFFSPLFLLHSDYSLLCLSIPSISSFHSLDFLYSLPLRERR